MKALFLLACALTFGCTDPEVTDKIATYCTGFNLDAFGVTE